MRLYTVALCTTCGLYTSFLTPGVFATNKKLAQARHATAVIKSLDHYSFQRADGANPVNVKRKHHVLELTVKLPDGTRKSWSAIQIARRLESASKFGGDSSISSNPDMPVSKRATDVCMIRVQCVPLACFQQCVSLMWLSVT